MEVVFLSKVEPNFLENHLRRAQNNCPMLSTGDWMRLRHWYSSNGRHGLPWRRDTSPWKVLLAEVLLHRTKASAVDSIYLDVLERFPSPEAIIREPDEWLNMARPLGLSWRARIFVTACESLVANHAGKVPCSLPVLLGLPGVGNYIASAVRCFAFGFPQVIIDTNTIRVASRVSQEALDVSRHRSANVKRAVARLSEDGEGSAPKDNYALLDLAASVCHPMEPDCFKCPIVNGCRTGRGPVFGQTFGHESSP